MKQSDIIQQVASGLSGINDTPAIREALNNTMDAAERSGELSRKTADSWDQDYMVVRVRSRWRQIKLEEKT